jgi:thiol-disulfide isomerase/thioredoxin
LAFFGAAFLLLCASLLLPGLARAEGEVRALLFYAEGCERCRAVEEEVLPLVQGAFPLEVRVLEVGDPENFRMLARYQDARGVPEGEVPVVVLADRILQGEEEIRAGLLPAVLELAAAGGSEWPPPPGGEGTATVAAAAGPIGVVYFYRPGCARCDRVQLALDYLARTWDLEIRSYDAADPDNQLLHERYDRAYGVAEVERLAAPAVYVGEFAFSGDALTRRALERAVGEAAGIPPPWERLGGEGAAEAAQGILSRYRNFGPVAVALAGLLDGVNPCAFATLLFLLSYLAYTGRSPREVVAIGSLFTAGVFGTYLATGLGLLAFLRELTGFAAVARWVYRLTAAGALVLAALSLRDFALCLRGHAREMTLQLPTFLKRRVHASIRSRLGLRATGTAAFATGAAVSVLELACTGQVYLPTLVYVSSLPGERLGAVGYLVLYNLAFIAPLVALFALAWAGVGSRVLEGFLRRNVAWVKLALSGLFLGLAALMLATV